MDEAEPPDPGWYPDPASGTGQRYWDGERWTEQTREMAERASAPASAPTGRRKIIAVIAVAAVLLALAGAGFVLWRTGSDEASPDGGADVSDGECPAAPANDEGLVTVAELQARSPDGTPPTVDAMQHAVELITERIEKMCVPGADVALDGQRVVITIPGQDDAQARVLAQTAELNFRKVVAGPFRVDESQQVRDDDRAEDVGAEIRQARQLRQNPDMLSDGAEAADAVEQALDSMDCSADTPDPLAGNDDLDLPLVTCERATADAGAEGVAYVLGPVILSGERIVDASFGPNEHGPGYEVRIEFDDEGTRLWAELTAELAQESATRGAADPARVAFVLDTAVVSAPSVTQPIEGNTRITSDFTQDEARDLAGVLNHGSLPLVLEVVDVTTEMR